jgi:hypothetical protein
VIWFFFEASHGKGAPDGVVGALKKRSADRAVHHGKDIPDARALYNVLKVLISSVMFFINESDVEARAEVTLLPPHTHIHTFFLYSSWFSIEMYKVFVTLYILSYAISSHLRCLPYMPLTNNEDSSGYQCLTRPDKIQGHYLSVQEE